MAKVATTYACTSCGTQSPVQLGKCPRCGDWGTMEARSEPSGGLARRRVQAGRTLEVQSLEEVADSSLKRVPSGIAEVDRVLGGGWVPGSVILIAGEPGIGKSTLLLQLAHHASRALQRLLYVAGEESLAQVKLRAERLEVGMSMALTREIDARLLAEHLRQDKPNLVIVDSIQTLLSEDDGTPGNLVMVRDSTAILSQAAKEAGSTLVLIGHVTKQGAIAGPKVVEHVVDATLTLESASGFRVLRALKNRFGPAGEMGVFEMGEGGMTAVANPSEAFLAERPQGVPGSVVVAALEGQRPLLLEVQALAAKSPYAAPRRSVQGLDARRVDMVLAVLERRLELPLASLDVYLNVAGGLRLTDPGADLAVAVAVYSAVTNKTVPEGTAVVGEVGLAGELRTVTQLARRVAEAKRSGYRLLTPSSGEGGLLQAKSLAQALDALWNA